jgi:hypothetical protein
VEGVRALGEVKQKLRIYNIFFNTRMVVFGTININEVALDVIALFVSVDVVQGPG